MKPPKNHHPKNLPPRNQYPTAKERIATHNRNKHRNKRNSTNATELDKRYQLEELNKQ